jgi:hypothetical protein
MAGPYFGKYRGTAVSVTDPQGQGRVQVQVPAVLGDAPAWAMPCFPVAGSGGAGVLALPAVGASLWVEFEAGDASRPIWVGSFLAEPGSFPATATGLTEATPGIQLQTVLGAMLALADDPAAQLVLKSPSGAAIIIGTSGITITNGAGATIKLEGPQVSINGDALVVI